jgi:hypothetical protein
MKHTIYVLLAIFCFALTAAAQSGAPKTVEDFYMLLPAKYIQPLAAVKDRRKLVKTRDIANGYLYLSGESSMPDWEGWAEVALFKKTNGDYLIGVVDGSCATFCYSGVEFLEYKNGKWTEATAKVLPEITDKMTLDRYKEIFPDSTEYDARNPPHTNYELPQKGTTVKVNANEAGADNTLLFELSWNGARFELKK